MRKIRHIFEVEELAELPPAVTVVPAQLAPLALAPLLALLAPQVAPLTSLLTP